MERAFCPLVEIRHSSNGRGTAWTAPLWLGYFAPMADHALNARGLRCPLPVLRARKALSAIAVGDTLTVEATDPAAQRDVPAFCAATGHSLRASETIDGVYRFVIERTV